MLSYVLFVCKCVLYNCHRMSTQLQLTNTCISIITFGQAIPLQALEGSLGLQDVEAPSISRQSAHENGRLLALHTGNLECVYRCVDKYCLLLQGAS